MPGARLPPNRANARRNPKVPPATIKWEAGGAWISSVRLTPSHRSPQFVRDLRPGHAAVLKLPVAHGGELVPGPGPFAPDTNDRCKPAPDRHDHRRPGPTTLVGGRDGHQSGQLAALPSVCGNGPSALSVRVESQYSRISLIFPSSRRNTRQ